MSRKITTIDGVKNLPLPNGWNISAGDKIVVSDSVWKQILGNDRVAANVKDLGATTDPVTDQPSWGEIQQVGAGVRVEVIAAGQTYPADTVPLGSVILREVS